MSKLKYKSSLALAAGLLTFSLSASAHFIVMYTPQAALNRAADVPFHLIFTHAFHGGPTMPLERPERFYLFHHQDMWEMPTEVDLLPYLEAIEWQTGDHEVQAWQATIPRADMRAMGDYQIVLEPRPYWDEDEGLYIQQFSKVIMNVGGVPGNWSQTLGLPAEIQPLNKPYANWTNGIFRGVVLSDSLPVPYARVEIEYLNHPPEVENRQFAAEALIEAPHPAFASMTILANEQGEFSFAMPKAGWWGFAALTVGPERQHEGEFLSQDAILWVQVTDLPD